MARLRLFVALELPAEMRAELAAVQARLRPQMITQPKWVSPESMHLTLKFLGSVDESLVEQLTAAMQRAVRGVEPFELRLGQAGTFGGRKPSVAWVGLTGGVDPLLALQRSVQEEVTPLGFSADARAYRPHLTLARIPRDFSRADAASLKAAIATSRPRPARARCDEIALMRSILGPDGAVYERLASAPFKP